MTSIEGWPLFRTAPTNRGKKTTNKFQASNLDHVLRLLGTGEICFYYRPKSPPFCILEFIQSKLNNGKAKLGPPIDFAHTIELIETKVFSNGIRKETVDGNVILWRNGLPGLRNLIADKLGDFPGQITNLYRELHWLIERGERTYLPRHPEMGINIHEFMWDDFSGYAMFQELECMPKFVGDRTTPPTEWDFFRRAFCEVCQDINELSYSAIAEKRVIGSAGQSGTRQFVPAENISSCEGDAAHEEISFALSSDLPSSWFLDELQEKEISSGPSAKRKPLKTNKFNENAKNLIEARFHFQIEDRRFTLATASEVLKEKYGISDFQFNKHVRKKYSSRFRDNKGDFPAIQKVNAQELLDYFNEKFD